MHKMKKALLPLFLAIAMLVMAVSAGAASSPTPKTLGSVKVASVTYNGAAQKPAVTVKDSAGNKLASKYYTVKYSNNTNAGTATVTVTAKAPYTGSKKATFKVNKGGVKVTVNGKKSVSLKKGKAAKVVFTYKNSKGSWVTAPVSASYKTNKKSVATVKAGKITAKKKGKALISVSVKGGKNFKSYVKHIPVTVK